MIFLFPLKLLSQLEHLEVSSTIYWAPHVTDKYFEIPYQASFQAFLPGAPSSSVPFHVTPLPSANFQLALSKDFISNGIVVLTGAASVNVTNQGGNQLMTLNLAGLIPEAVVSRIQFSLVDGKLLISLSQDSFNIVQNKSPIGSISAQTFHRWIKDLLQDRFLPTMNDMFSAGIILPSVLNTQWSKVSIAIYQGGLVISM
ncbi:PREDICTED: uncharacterized protein LOC109294651 [Gavialis gangeticus]|uniref:uncharacterized protein LOC109294651 n=1 Tax=Gavialis gangeticus TaxID=94835 RepID=UPI00092F0B19|nr:PREDICTED: uncharacterized protein LOC109294651 [Gavialis gangeticus]